MSFLLVFSKGDSREFWLLYHDKLKNSKHLIYFDAFFLVVPFKLNIFV
jgi:hypothetical protein